MKTAACPIDEHLRLEALQRYGVLDTEAEASFDGITSLLASICGTPIALVSLVDSERQWFKSRVGLDAEETHRDLAFCAHAILKEELLIVEDATKDERFFDNPLVTSGPEIRFYAGAPLITPDGHAIGTLCAIDTTPRTLSAQQKQALSTLSKHVINLLELSLTLKKTQTLNHQLQESQEKLNASNESQQRFFANINHEMRTPLNAVNGFTKLLIKRVKKENLPPYVTDGLDFIKIAADRLKDLVDDVLDISKIDAGKMTLSLHPFNVWNLLSNTMTIVSMRSQDIGVNTAFNIAADVPNEMIGDEKKINQIALNLLSNAIKFTPAGKTVIATLSWRDNQLCFSVQDEGIGIPENELKSIFLPFEQSAHSIQSEFKGTGLGLSIVQSFVDLMHGTIDVKSELNKGTIMTVMLPLAIKEG